MMNLNKKIIFGIFISVLSLYLASALGCCFNPGDGQCIRNADEDACISPGVFSLKPDCSADSKCTIGCCVRSNAGAMTTQRECNILSDSAGLETNWVSGASEEECASVGKESEYGACISGSYPPYKCKYKTAKDCSAQYFYAGVSCAAPQLNTTCKKTSNTMCWPKSVGNDTGDVYTKDSCGNPDEKVADCDYSAGNVCKQVSATKAECKNLNCYDEKTKVTRINGESWCAYDSFEYFDYEKDKNWVLEPVGSRFARKYCLNGEIKTELCADYRGEYCSQGACIANNWDQCLSSEVDSCEDPINHCAVLNGHPGCGNPISEPDINYAFCKMNGEMKKLGEMPIEEVRAITGIENLQSATSLPSEFRPVLKEEILSNPEKKLKICFSTLAGGVSFWQQTKDGLCSRGNYNAEIKFGVDSDVGGGADATTIYYLKTDGEGETGKYGWAGLFDLNPTHWTHKTVQIKNPYFEIRWWQPDEKDLVQNRAETMIEDEKLYCTWGNPLQTQNSNPYSEGPFGCNMFSGDKTIFEIPIDPWLAEFLDWRCQNIGDCDGKLNYAGQAGTGKAEGSWDVSFNNSGNSSDGRIPDVAEWKYAFDNGYTLTFKTYASDDHWSDNAIVTLPDGTTKKVNANEHLRKKRFGSLGPAKFAGDNHGEKLTYALGGEKAGQMVEVYSDGYRKNVDEIVMGTYKNLNSIYGINLGTPISLQTKVITYKTGIGSSQIGTTDAEGNLQVAPGAKLTITCTKKENEITCPIEYTCSAWRAPSSSDKCGNCGKDGIGCSEYRCKSLGRNCDFKMPDGADKGYCIAITDRTPPIIISKSYSPGSPVQPWTPITIQLKTNENSFCKFNMGYSGASFEDMKYDFSSGFGTEHTLTLTLPGKVSDEEGFVKQYPLIQSGGKYDMFIRCEDVAGNYNTAASLVNFEVMQTPEYVPAVITNITPVSGSRIESGATEKEIKFKLNEPATCKWDFNDKAYDSMAYEFSCSTIITDSNSINGYWCSGKLKNITTDVKNETKFYIRCKDNPQFQGNETGLYKRNENPTGKEYKLRASEALQITDITPSGTKRLSAADLAIQLRAITSKGAFNGQAECRWALGKTSDLTRASIVKFSTTGGNTHSQAISSPEIGENFVRIVCRDSAGNIAEKNASFIIEIDRTPPMITRILSATGFLKIKTDEFSACYFSFDSKQKCQFSTENASQMTGVEQEHTTEWKDDKTYYVKCKDFLGNEDSNCGKIIRTY